MLLILAVSLCIAIVAACAKFGSRRNPYSANIASRMVFAAVFDALSPTERENIRLRLTTIATASAIGRQIEANIALEARLPFDAAKHIVETLLGEPNVADRLRIKYTEICNQHILSGPNIGGIRPKVLGRAVVLPRLCARLVKDGRFRTVQHAEAWLKRQCKLDPPKLRASLQDVPLGGQVTWATFREPSRSEDPFVPLPSQPTALHDALALDLKDRGLPLVLFVYSPPAGLPLRFPTIADARWGRQFRPAVNDSACTCGLTAPPTDDPAIKPMPEVVHPHVNGDLLTSPMRVIR
jgi:hypothetical protein